jgi:hypothetical protein
VDSAASRIAEMNAARMAGSAILAAQISKHGPSGRAGSSLLAATGVSDGASMLILIETRIGLIGRAQGSFGKLVRGNRNLKYLL